MKIREHDLDIAVQEELEAFDWSGAEIRGNKFIACSPFRSERHPSFAVNLDSGLWIDSGNSDEYQHKGNLVKLLSLLRNEEYVETEDYLIEKYATILSDTDSLTLCLNLAVEQNTHKTFSMASLGHLYMVKTDYLNKRGISAAVQEQFHIGYDPVNKAIALLWTDGKGAIINVKYRRTYAKSFYYEKEGQPIKHYVYGLYQCKIHKAKRVFICESEIDALTLWTHGYPAIAVGGSSLSENQKRLILSAGIEELVIATDNDVVGNRFREFLKGEFMGILTVLDFVTPAKVKDVNELLQKDVTTNLENCINTVLPRFNLNI